MDGNSFGAPAKLTRAQKAAMYQAVVRKLAKRAPITPEDMDTMVRELARNHGITRRKVLWLVHWMQQRVTGPRLGEMQLKVLAGPRP